MVAHICNPRAVNWGRIISSSSRLALETSEILTFPTKSEEFDVTVCICNPSTEEATTGRLLPIPDQPLHSESAVFSEF